MDDAALSGSTEGGMIEEVVASVWSMDSTIRTPRRTLDLAGRIGKRPVRMLIDSGATGNYKSAQECAARRIKIEREQGGKELTMANGSSVKTLGRVRLNVKCGGDQGIVEARVFPQMTKPMILGMPWLVKEYTHINWTRSIVVVQQGQDWISLPLAKLGEDTLVHLVKHDQCKTNESVAQEEASGQCLPQVCPDGQGR